jgi:hypothetical protein
MVRRVIDERWSVMEAAAAAGVSDRTGAKWVARFRADGEAGLLDRSSAPRAVAHRTPDELVEAIVMLRRLRMTGAEIAFCLAMALSTVSAVLLCVGLGKLSRLGPPEPPNRDGRRHPGELIHVDVKKLGRIVDGAGHRIHGDRTRQRRQVRAGWEYVHVCVDDATRLAYVEVLPDERATTAVGFLHRGRLLRRARRQRRAGDERQRPLLPIHDPRVRLPRDGTASPAHPPLPTAHQRQGGAIHPHAARRLGLRRDLQLKPRTRRRALEFPRFRGHLIAGPSGPAVRIGVHAIHPAVFRGLPS